MQVLQDKSKMLVCLIDCRLVDNQLNCGAAVFRGGLRGKIEVSDGTNKFIIEVPESIAKAATYVALHDPKTKYLELKICR
jgi:hypothetical protein